MKHKVGAIVQWREKLPTMGLPYLFQGVIAEVRQGTCLVRMKSGVKRVVKNEVLNYADE